MTTTLAHQIPMELVSKILLMRPTHPNAVLIKAVVKRCEVTKLFALMCFLKQEYPVEWANESYQLDDMITDKKDAYKTSEFYNKWRYSPDGRKWRKGSKKILVIN